MGSALEHRQRILPKTVRRAGPASWAGLTLFFLIAIPTLGQEAAEPVIKVLVRGATITNTSRGNIPFQDFVADIRKNFPETRQLLDSVTLQVIDLRRSGQSADDLELARVANQVIQEPAVKGVIVTQGTNTSEDTAYFLHLLVRSEKPIVIANSQRRHDVVGNDGDRNFVDAIRVVVTPESAGKGVLVVTNQTINSGREVQKSSVRPGGFVSGEHGFLGIIEEDRVDFYRSPMRRHTFRSEFDVDAIAVLPKVEIIYAYSGADPALIQAAVDSGAKGIVINGVGNHGAPDDSQEPILTALAAKGVSIVLSARGGVNNRVPVNSLDKFIDGDNLVAHKARTLLQIALTKTSDPKEIQRIFNEY